MSLSIKHWPNEDRPREKLIRYGSSQLTDTELLAIFLRTGVRGKSAIDLARDMLQQFGSLRQLLKISHAQFCEMKGLGTAKYTQLQAVFEMAKRAIDETLEVGTVIKCAEDAIHYLQYQLQHQAHEVLFAIFLNNQNTVIAAKVLSEGTVDQAQLHPRQLIEQVIKHHAKSVILAHNHPSGNPSPSQSDHQLTDQLKQALHTIDAPLLDHIIIGHGCYYAFSTHTIFPLLNQSQCGSIKVV